MSQFSISCARCAAIAALLFAPFATALPPSFPGSVDPTYGANGILALGVKSGYENAYIIVPAPEGKWLVSGNAAAADGGDNARYLMRLHSDGRIDAGFGAQGLAFAPGSPGVLAVQASGRMVIADHGRDTEGVFMTALRRLLHDGSPDPDFGTAAGATLLGAAPAATPTRVIEALDADPQGRIIGAASLRSVDYATMRGEVWRFSANGIPDAAFGSQGRVTLDDIGPYLQLKRVRAQRDGKVVAAALCQASANAKPRACVLRLNSDGSRDATFGPNGVRDIAPPVDTAYYVYDLRIANDGRLYVGGANFESGSAKAFVMRLHTDGTLDAGYGTGGVAALAFPDAAAYVNAIQFLADGSQIVVGIIVTGVGEGTGYVARLTSNGVLDPAFGAAGFGARAATQSHSFDDGVVLADGGILAVGRRYNVPGTATDIDTLLVRYVGVETLGEVIEFHNTMLDHYFITADPNEAAAIDGGSAGPGWVRTGSTFKSGGPNRVCRFYGTIDIDPATGLRRGPNSHFYTIDAAECAWVKLDPGWHFESYDFSGWPRGGDGACPAGTIPVKRVYNGRFAQNDSNHRYTTSNATYDQMVALSWWAEGVVFCTVP